MARDAYAVIQTGERPLLRLLHVPQGVIPPDA
jgi:L-fucose mutarotase/ribose pyranase (RbsD/FucU family)